MKWRHGFYLRGLDLGSVNQSTSCRLIPLGVVCKDRVALEILCCCRLLVYLLLLFLLGSLSHQNLQFIVSDCNAKLTFETLLELLHTMGAVPDPHDLLLIPFLLKCAAMHLNGLIRHPE
jgi:hypothetical protein